MDGYWVWDGSTIRGEDGRYHLFASRWPSFHMIMKDQSGHITGDEGSGIYMASEDGTHREMGEPPLAYTRKLTWDTGESEEVSNFERPQLLFNESGEMTHMIGATARGQGLNKATETCVTIVPLKSS